MLNETELHELLLQSKAGTLDAEGRRRLDEWAGESEVNRELLALLSDDSLREDLRRLMSYDQERVWKNIRKAAAEKRRSPRFGTWWRMAAAAVALVALVMGVHYSVQRFAVPQGIVSVIQPGRTMALLQLSSGETVELTDGPANSIREADATEILIDSAATKFKSSAQKKTAETLFNTVVVPKGCEYHVELCDGTKVWLNAGSEMTFPTQFDTKTRSVTLRGEAYFEVTSNAKWPFVVNTPQLAVEVFGTSFNVMCYDDEPTVETTLVTGSVKVRGGKIETMLSPGMQAQYDLGGKTMEVRPVYAENYAAWSKQMFVFFDEPIESICRKLARWYNVEIDAGSPRLKGIRYSGMIRRAETFNSVAELLSSTDDLKFTEVSGKMVVDRK